MMVLVPHWLNDISQCTVPLDRVTTSVLCLGVLGRERLQNRANCIFSTRIEPQIHLRRVFDSCSLCDVVAGECQGNVDGGA